MKTEVYVCDGCGKSARLGPVPKGARNHYCDCNPTAPFYMVSREIRRGTLQAIGSIGITKPTTKKPRRN